MDKIFPPTLLFGLLCANHANGQVAKAQQISRKLFVNGQPINGELLVSNGKHFVAIEDLAESLEGAISYSRANITLTLKSPQPQELKKEAGHIKGTVTYFFNSNCGNKPDTGSHVWPAESNLTILDDGFLFRMGSGFTLSEIDNKTAKTYKSLKHFVADAAGNFDLRAMRPGLIR